MNSYGIIMDDKKVDNDLQLLKQLNLTEVDMDDVLINEANQDIKQIEQDLLDLMDSMKILDELVQKDGVKLVIAEQNVYQADNDILKGDNELEIVTHEYTKGMILKTTIGVLAGAAIVGTPCGIAFGISAALIAGGTGGVIGGSIGFLSKYFI